MKYICLTQNDLEYVSQCDCLLADFFKSEANYDSNYLIQDKLKSLLNDLEDNNNILLAAIDETRVVGFLFAYINKLKTDILPVAHIAFVYVDTQHRKKGIATQLITTLFKQLEKRNIDIVEVKAFNDNIAATNLYEKFGFDVLWVNYRRKISNN